ncbi:ATPase [Corallococcus sp. H22C18031201]|uniref:ATP-binding protein n=1 Tax=Citreicoccus inhibens TaxID=2849499 RepID=UPI000E72448B|nr:AAA family ATPase [Citreicoccus inhibens]MBU8896671.1 AAA family ATPase [Citreicoccus inhibens]RJS14734.1 ATPase [Corallococcus sp. H22C18031201]
MPDIRLPAETKYKTELDALAAHDSRPRPPGWRLSPRAVETYILGSDTPVGGVKISPKYVGDRSLVQVCIATLASDRALMLVGEPGTAKSWLSEHLCAAISGTSSLIIQGTAGTSEDHIKYAWNYALLLSLGPTPEALVPSPILRAMRAGQFARFEEVTRTSSEIQDALISLLSEKQVSIPELGRVESAQRGFNLVATANTRDRGVNEMSAALKRRFNFVTVPVVEDLEQELRIVTMREAELRSEYATGVPPSEELSRVLLTLFQELRRGVTLDGRTRVRPPETVLSTSEAISVLFNSAILAEQFGTGEVTSQELAASLLGAVSKERKEDEQALRDYMETVAKVRTGPWKSLYAESKKLLRR